MNGRIEKPKLKNIVEVFFRFLSLGLVSFGGPAAHLGYFRNTFVEKLNWLDDAGYARLVALSQFLPGPASSQAGFAIGLHRAGLFGGIAAFIGFTAPSFVLMTLLAVNVDRLNQQSWYDDVVHGLKLLAVIVVVDATLGMAKTFCKTKLTQTITMLTASAVLLAGSLWMQLLAIIVAALAGRLFIQTDSQPMHEKTKGINWLPLVLFTLLFAAAFWPTITGSLASLFQDFYLSGSLVFGGGHVVLPFLQQMLASQMESDVFLTGYAAAQAVPGPMFTLASFLGGNLFENVWLGSLVATLAIFLPGFLLILALKDSWDQLAQRPSWASAVSGINASVVGLLAAACYQPVFVSAVLSPLDFVMVLAGYLALRIWKVPVLVLAVGLPMVQLGGF